MAVDGIDRLIIDVLAILEKLVRTYHRIRAGPWEAPMIKAIGLLITTYPSYP
jgi:hypothetical protein